MRPENYQRAFQTILQSKDQHTVLQTADACNPIDFLPDLMAGEVTETQVEIEKWGTKKYNRLETGKEWVDIWVFFTFVCQRLGVYPDFSHAVARANGQATASNFFDNLREKAQNMSHGNHEQNVQDFTVQLVSLGNHLPEPVKLEKVVTAVLKKNNENRSPLFYKTPISLEEVAPPKDAPWILQVMEELESSKNLTTSEKLQKYSHNEKMLRKIRSHYKKFSGGVLSRWMYEPFIDLILDFRHSEQNLALLSHQLPVQDELLKQKIFFLLQEQHREPQMPKQQFEYGLFLTGTLLSIVE